MQSFGGDGGRSTDSMNGGGAGVPVVLGGAGGPLGGFQNTKFKAGAEKADNINPQSPDCYFYFYSTCSKGGQCKFRHCSAALGTEEVCDLWLQQQNCRRKICAFRHSKPERQRNAIPCFWEAQSVGCLKPHCPFLHLKPRPQLPSVMDRLDTFKKNEFEQMKVKTLEEIQEEKQTVAVATPSFTARQSYNLTYTPSPQPPPSSSSSSSSSSSQTSFKLTNVLKTTGLSGGGGRGGGAKTTNLSSAKTSTATKIEISQAVSISQPIATNTAHVTKPFAVHQSSSTSFKKPIQLSLSQPSLKVGGASAGVGRALVKVGGASGRVGGASVKVGGVSEQTLMRSIFTSSNNQMVEKERVVMREEEEEEEGERRRRKTNISAITWGDDDGGEGGEKEQGGGEKEEEEEGGKMVELEKKRESRIARFHHQQSSADDQIQVTKKIKLMPTNTNSLPSSSSSSSSSAAIPPPPQPRAASSPIKSPLTTNEKGNVLLASKVGVAIGGCGQLSSDQSGFQVKSLDEIRAEKRKRQVVREGKNSAGCQGEVPAVAKETPVTATTTATGEKKIIRLKKRLAAVTRGDHPAAERRRREGGEREEEEEEEESKRNERKSVEEDNEKDKVFVAPVTKRRKLSRTPLSLVQTTPTITSSEITSTSGSHLEPKLTTKSQREPRDTTHNQTLSNLPPVGGAIADCTERDIIEQSQHLHEKPGLDQTRREEEKKEEGEKEEEEKEEEAGDKEEEETGPSRKLSVSEMKAQIQSELRDRSDSYSMDEQLLLDTEMAQWEEVLGEKDEEGEDDDKLLNSKTDDDLMLDMAELL